MTDSSPAQVIQMLLAKPTDRQHVKSLTTPDITYVSLSENNPELKRYLPWAGTNKGPDSIVNTFEGIGRTWETKAFEVREVIEQGETVAMFGSFIAAANRARRLLRRFLYSPTSSRVRLPTFSSSRTPLVPPERCRSRRDRCFVPPLMRLQ
jgi:hypothetical protein